MRVVNALQTHFWVLLSVFLDLGVAGLVALTYKYDILLPFPKSTVEKNLQDFLPTFGTLLGGIIGYVNKNAISALVTVRARRRMASKGVTFRQLSYYDELAKGGVPKTLRSIFFFAITVTLSVGLISPAVVNSLTPTAINWGTVRSMPSVSFSAQSGVTPPIYCEYGGGNVNRYGYGINCPLDTAYGEMFNAFTTSLRGTFPVNSTYQGTSYPSNLIGISGAISTLTQRLADQTSGAKKRAVLPADTLDTCVPRINITATCSPNLPSGMTFQSQTLSVSGNVPNNIVRVSLCHSDGSCNGPRYAPDYGNGMISLFRESDTSSGQTDMGIFSVGKYATNLTSPNIFCTITAKEEFVPVRITGGISVERLSSLSCQGEPAPSPRFLANITRLAEMGLEKSQGQDGKLEAISHTPDGANRIEAIELGIERMVAIAATNMYSTIDGLTGENATWTRSQEYSLKTPRRRLGVQGKYTVIFIISPAILLILLVVSWLAVGFARENNLGFNPLDPLSAMTAGMNRDRLPVEIANLSDADQNTLSSSDLLLKYGYVNGQRMGMMAMGGAFVQEGYSAPSPALVSGYKGESPMSSPFPTPNIHNGPAPFFR